MRRTGRAMPRPLTQTRQEAPERPAKPHRPDRHDHRHEHEHAYRHRPGRRDRRTPGLRAPGRTPRRAETTTCSTWRKGLLDRLPRVVRPPRYPRPQPPRGPATAADHRARHRGKAREHCCGGNTHRDQSPPRQPTSPWCPPAASTTTTRTRTKVGGLTCCSTPPSRSNPREHSPTPARHQRRRANGTIGLPDPPDKALRQPAPTHHRRPRHARHGHGNPRGAPQTLATTTPAGPGLTSPGPPAAPVTVVTHRSGGRHRVIDPVAD